MKWHSGRNQLPHTHLISFNKDGKDRDLDRKVGKGFEKLLFIVSMHMLNNHKNTEHI